MIFLFCIACAQVPDVPICVDLSSRGWCTYTISQKEFYLEGEPWNKVKGHSLLVPADSWEKIKEYILINCKKNQDCKNKLGSWDRTTQTIFSSNPLAWE